jgi:hypothetical protein
MTDHDMPVPPLDWHGQEWRLLCEYLQARIQVLRIENDSLAMSERTTIEKRARIAELKSLLALPEAGKPLHPADEA